MSALLAGLVFSRASVWVQMTVEQPGADGDQKDSVTAAPLFLCLVSSYLVLLWAVIEEKMVISPLKPGVSALMEDQLSCGRTCVQRAVEQPLLPGADGD